MEGIIPYRLLGNHPAASGKRHMLSFSGETVSVGRVLENIIQEHHINESIFKLDVQLVRGETNNEKKPNISLTKESILQNYDRIDVTVSQKRITDEESKRQKNAHSCNFYEDSLSDPLLVHVEKRSHILPEAGQEDLEFQRAAVLLKKNFPLFPGRVLDPEKNNSSVSSACVLCDYPPFEPVELPCCHFHVCRKCKDSAETMVSKGKCVICGHMQRQPDNNRMKEEHFSVKLEGVGASAVGTSDKAVHEIGSTRPKEDLLRLGKILKDNLDRSLSLLDIPDPVPIESKNKRYRSEVLVQLDRLVIEECTKNST